MILLHSDQTPTRRVLLQDPEGLMVLSECCVSKIMKDGYESYVCHDCGATLIETRGNTYVSSVTFDEIRDYGWTAGWGSWLEFWFGLKYAELSFDGLFEGSGT